MRRFAAGLLLFAFVSMPGFSAELPGAGPKIGIHYLTWFMPPGCGPLANGWGNLLDGYPFNAPGPVGSLVHPGYPNGWDYCSTGTIQNSGDYNPAFIHAILFRDLGVDFIILDQTNTSKTSTVPNDNEEFKGAKNAIEGLSSYAQKKIEYAFQLSLTCWGAQCWPGIPACAALPKTENLHRQRPQRGAS